ncbi:MAG: PIN domain-containing protein [Thermoanaerobaculia bacterium]
MVVLVDTNVILSAVTDRNAVQRAGAERLFRQAASGAEQIVIAQFVLFETHYVMRNLYKQSDADVAALLADLVALPGAVVQHALPLARLFELWPSSIREFADASLAAMALEMGCSIATFDSRFTRRLRSLGIAVWSPE